MLQCPKCKTKDLVGAKIVETGIVTTYEIINNPKFGTTDLTVYRVDDATTENGDAYNSIRNIHKMMLACPKCKASVPVHAELSFGRGGRGYAILPHVSGDVK
jgi:predicted nucleic-acid-binding Zn-ribbon protein